MDRCWFLLACFVTGFPVVSCMYTFQMEKYCGQEVSMIMADDYQSRLQLNVDSFLYTWMANAGTSCDVEVEGWYHMDRLMFYFEQLNISCDIGYLRFHDGETNLDTTFTDLKKLCGNNHPSGVFVATGMSVTISYHMNQMTSKHNAAKIVFTAFRKGKCELGEFKCKNGRCIPDQLMCTKYNPCGDNSDCPPEKLSSATVAGIIIGTLAGIGVIGTTAVLTICYVISRRQRLKQQDAPREMSRHYPTAPQAVTSTSPPSDVTSAPPVYTLTPSHIQPQSWIAPLRARQELQMDDVDVSSKK